MAIGAVNDPHGVLSMLSGAEVRRTAGRKPAGTMPKSRKRSKQADAEENMEGLRGQLEDVYQRHLRGEVELTADRLDWLINLRLGVHALTSETDREIARELVSQQADVSQETKPAAGPRVPAGSRPAVRRKAGEDGPMTIVHLPVSALHLLPENAEPAADKVADLAESFGDRGQDEPIVVRPGGAGCPGYDVPEDEWQVLSGATRVLAARAIGWDRIDGRIRADLVSREAALTFAWGTNLDRRVITQRERLRYIRSLREAGVPQSEVGQLLHVSRGEVANLERLGALPDRWIERIDAGEISYTVVRDAILPYADAPQVLAELERAWENQYERYETFTGAREEIVGAVLSLVTDCTRQLSGVKYWSQGRDHAVAIDVTDAAVREQIQPATIPVLVRGKRELVEVATAAEAFDRLQDAAVAATVAKKGQRAERLADEPTPTRPERADPEEERRKAKEAADQLKHRVEEWRDVIMPRALIAESLRHTSDDTLQMETPAVALRLIAEFAGRGGQVEICRALLVGSGGKVPASAYDRGDPWGAILRRVPIGADGWRMVRVLVDAAAHLVFPPARWEDKEAKLVWLESRVIVDCCTELDVGVSDGWREARDSESPLHQLLREFFALHQKVQLQALARELGQAEIADAAPNKAALVEDLLIAHAEEGLPLPKCLAKGGKKGGAK